jgi:hypothetical protein
MATTIQVKRGLVGNLPASGASGEPIYTTDDQQLHFGTGAAVVPLKIAAGNVTGLVNGGSETVNAQSGTSYTVVVGDAGKLVTLANASAVGVSLVTANYTAGFFIDTQNKGTADATFTPTAGTINAAGTLVLHAGQGCRIVFDGTNYQVVFGRTVVAKSAVGSQWLNSMGADGVATSTQPAFTDISGSLAAGQLPATIDGGTF